MKQRLIHVCCILAVLVACAHPRKAEFEAVRTQSQKYYDTGDYQNALDSYRGLYTRFPKDSDLADSYLYMMETVKKQADRGYAREEYATSYSIYQILSEYYDDFTEHEKKPSFSISSVHERMKLSQIRLAEGTSRQRLSLDDFQGAIDVCREIYRKYRQDSLSQECLVSTEKELGEKGDTAYNKGDYSSAAKIYLVLRKNAQLFKASGISVKHDIRALNAQLVNCSTHLNRKGLELYRKGELRKALDVWKDILEFDPDNAEVRRAVDITSEQIKNLQ